MLTDAELQWLADALRPKFEARLRQLIREEIAAALDDDADAEAEVQEWALSNDRIRLREADTLDNPKVLGL